MRKEAKQLLRQFQCDYNRMLEETFAQTLSENDRVRLFFVNENEAFTDGHNIVVDPAMDDLFDDEIALRDTADFLHWQPMLLSDRWNALRIITRAQTIHECLHILYSDFPPRAAYDPKCDTKLKRKVMSHISNIIEDAYIEAAGCSVYDNLEFYLRFGRVSRLFVTHPSQGTAERLLAAQSSEAADLLAYLDYMCGFLLYPMANQNPPFEAIAEYVEKTKQLFLDGSFAPSPAERYEYTNRIFDIILPLIPQTDVELEDEALKKRLGGSKTHSADASTIGTQTRKGKTQIVKTRLFFDADGKLRKDSTEPERLIRAIRTFEKDKYEARKLLLDCGSRDVFLGKDFDCAVMHKDIRINAIHPKINLNLRKAYQNIYSKYKININSYTGRFAQLLKARVSAREDKYRFGSGISSKMLADPQKRYWYRNVEGVDLPDLAILLLIDGSGSMNGARCKSAMISSLILHEVLKKQSFAHAIVEHRGKFEQPEIDVNILVDFNGREEEKYNLMQITANGDNRDGLALYWAERYINQQTHSDNKLIIVLSDGTPSHYYDQYFPPVSTKDTANAVRKIIKRGTEIIAISLDDAGSYDCYDQLKEIYPNLIACNDLTRLTGQLLGLIAKLI